jgi:hypothetical protein
VDQVSVSWKSSKASRQAKDMHIVDRQLNQLYASSRNMSYAHRNRRHPSIVLEAAQGL